MNQSTSLEREESLTSVESLAKMGLVAALYIAVTFIFSAVSFGAFQLRLSEMFNYLAIFHKRYIIAVTFGVIISNALWSPIKVIDIPVGTLHTLLALIVVRAVTKRMKNMKAKFVVTAAILVVSMFIIALQLYFVLDLPFWLTYGSTALGELVAMTVGGFIMYFVSKKIDLTK